MFWWVIPSTQKDNTETWNGSNWTEVNDLNTPKRNFRRQVALLRQHLHYALVVMILPASYALKTESWNGTNWTEVGDLNTASILGHSGASKHYALAFGGGHQQLKL